MAESDHRPDLRFTLITAAVLLALLAGVWAWLEVARPEETLWEGELTLPRVPESWRSEEDEAAEDRVADVRFTPELSVDGPTTLTLELEREPVEGWVGVAVALIHHDSGEVRQLALSSTYQRDVSTEGHGELSVDALVDQVQSGGWVVRLDPSWEPLAEPRPGREDAVDDLPEPPWVGLRVTQGRKSPWHLWLAVALILLPAVVQIGRRVWYTRRSKRTGGD